MDTNTNDTRTNIVNLLKINGKMTINEVSAQLDMSSMGVRQHLGSLERDGLVEYYRQKSNRGRPKYIYTLTDQAKEIFPESYKSFAMEILEEAEDIGGEDLVNQLLEQRMESQIQSYEKRLQGKNLDKKIEELAEIRNEEGYMANISKNGDDYALVEYHCPISMIAQKYPYLCETERELFQRTLGVEIKREHHLICGSHKCSYHIQAQM
ncbi:TPA: transcriptional regulator [Candidatus Poribacteria bacterium]|jgi:iron-sulfur cluster biosynthesis transcriptional regulator SufR|nr:transcriptional regulator [Candidatus Poribacteria bacterium]HIB90120.1 transcriptional regulator [Candidatus Poribacteria bacterium]HIB99775.1 transcriptional regulator [Candidatus Poribacteria bacterium]HIC18188.1 transcriptional regulator [Candidatus Poribacteria bacterium]HIN30953.1 transcriptional regulator [Candidatus Poribacteria bacterium]